MLGRDARHQIEQVRYRARVRHSAASVNPSARPTPYSPQEAAAASSTKRSHRAAVCSLGTIRPVTPAIATTITVGAAANRAETAASPSTRPPTMLIVCPMAPGVRAPASLSASSTNSIRRISQPMGRGTPRCAAETANSSRAGTNSR